MPLKTLRPDGKGGFTIEKGTDPVTLQRSKYKLSPKLEAAHREVEKFDGLFPRVKQLWATLILGGLLLAVTGCKTSGNVEAVGDLGSDGDVRAVTDSARGVVCYVLNYRAISCVADVIPAEEPAE